MTTAAYAETAAVGDAGSCGQDERDRRPLRVAFVVEDFPTLSETFVIYQAAGLVARGHDVQLLCLNHHRAPQGGVHQAVTRSDLLRRVARPVAGSLLLAPFARPEEEAGDRWGWLRRGCAFLAIAAMMARQRRFDIVHCQFAPLGLAILSQLDLGLLRCARLVVHLRGYDVTRLVQRRGRAVYARLFRRADMLIANCEHFRERAIELGAEPDRVKVIGSPIDTRLFAPKAHHMRAGPLRVIAVGRLVEKKGFADALSGFAAYARHDPGATLEMIGDGPLRPELETLAHTLEVGERVRFLGARHHGDVVAALQRADVMLAPSVTAASGDADAPVNTLKEAMAVGLPVIATRHGGIPELVDHEVSGFLVPERNPAAITRCLMRLASERERWPAMGAAGRHRVLQDYDQAVVTNRLLTLYRDLLDGKGEPA